MQYIVYILKGLFEHGWCASSVINNCKSIISANNQNTSHLAQNAWSFVQDVSRLYQNTSRLYQNVWRLHQNTSYLVQNAKRIKQNVSRFYQNTWRLHTNASYLVQDAGSFDTNSWHLVSNASRLYQNSSETNYPRARSYNRTPKCYALQTPALNNFHETKTALKRFIVKSFSQPNFLFASANTLRSAHAYLHRIS